MEPQRSSNSSRANNETLSGAGGRSRSTTSCINNAQIRQRIAERFQIKLTYDTYLSRFWVWYSRQRNFENVNDLIEQFDAFAGKRNPHWPAEKVRAVAIEFFLAQTIKNEDEASFAAILKLDQNERFGKTKKE